MCRDSFYIRQSSQHRQSSCAVYRTAALPVLAVLGDVERVTTHSTNASGALCAIFNNLYKIGPWGEQKISLKILYYSWSNCRTERIRCMRLGLVPSHSGLLRLTPSLLFGPNALNSPTHLLSFKYCAVCARSRHESESENRWNSRSAKTIRFPNSHELIWLFSWAPHKVYFFSPNHSVQQLRAFWRKIWPHICFQNIGHFRLQLWIFLNCFWHKECNIQNSLINDRGNIKTPLFINNKCNNWNLLKYRSTTL